MIDTSKLIIAKFGGTSVKSAEEMKLVYNILQKQKEKKIVVLSACGGITNLIIDCLQMSLKGKLSESELLLNKFETHHRELIENLILDIELKSQAHLIADMSFEILRNNSKGTLLLRDLPKIVEDKCVAQGELLSSMIFYYYCLSKKIKSHLLDIRSIISKREFDHSKIEVMVDSDKLQIALAEFNTNDVIITQGFICNDEFGNTSNLGRGGSDWTASILGGELNVKEIQIWTDVNGILTTDPRLISTSETIKSISFKDVQALSFYGAKVLHPETIKPAIDKNIPIIILNTFNPESKGTKISNIFIESEKLIKAVVLNDDCILYEFELNLNQNIKNNQSKDILTRFSSLHAIIYLYELRDNKLLVVIKKDEILQKYFEMDTFGSSFNAIEVDLIACIGVNNNVFNESDKILSFLSAKDCLIFNYNIETKILFSLFMPEKGNDFYNFIHQFTIE
ncbi:MAG: aspartate kinase [Candidatus Kapabacteria bacterium]|nr:aspartate kinase [Candidatus Kapabacteria bacterium]